MWQAEEYRDEVHLGALKAVARERALKKQAEEHRYESLAANLRIHGRRQIGFSPWTTQTATHDRAPDRATKQQAEKHRCVVC